MAKRRINTDKVPAPLLASSSQAVEADSLIFLSAQGANDVETGAYPPSLEAQMAQALENLKAVLEAAGSSMEGLVEKTVYLNSPNAGEAVRSALSLQERYMSHPVASTTIQPGRLVFERLVEIDGIAVQPDVPKEVVTTDRAPVPLSRTSTQGVRAGRYVFVTGQAARKPSWGPGQYLHGMDVEVEQTVANISAILEACGTSWDYVLTMTMYLSHQAAPGEAIEALDRHLPSPLVLPIVRLGMLVPATLALENVVAVMPDQLCCRLAVRGADSSRRVGGIRGGRFVIGYCEATPSEDMQQEIGGAFEELDTLLREGGSSLDELVRLRLFLGPSAELDAVLAGAQRFLPEVVASSVIRVEGLSASARLGMLGVGLAR